MIDGNDKIRTQHSPRNNRSCHFPQLTKNPNRLNKAALLQAQVLGQMDCQSVEKMCSDAWRWRKSWSFSHLIEQICGFSKERLYMKRQ